MANSNKRGDLRLDTLSLDLKASDAAGHWNEILDRINSGDMPPDMNPGQKPTK